MGAYLSAPLTDKESSDEINTLLACGASQMQGWRMSQEDAHICALDFDSDTSLFAVFDGHGGSEVALYCAQKLPEFLKQLDAYKNGDYEKALKDTFIGFDATLVNDNVIEEMKKLIPEKGRDPSTDSDDEADDEDINELYKEGRMPLSELLKKLRSGGAALASLAGGDGEGCADAESSQSSSRRRNRKPQPSSSNNGECSSEASKSNTVADEYGVTSTCSSSSAQTSSEKKEETKPDGNSECGSTADEAKPAPSKPKTAAAEANCSGSVSSSSTSKAAADASKESDSDSADDESTDSDSDESKNGKIAGENDEDDLDYTGDGEELEDEIDTEESDDEYPVEYEDDEKFLNGMFEGPGSSSGCTAVVALLKGNDLYVANAGDSRCVVCRDGKALDMSFNHKPEDKEELDRIHKAGGRVTMDGRVNGGLNLSRAIGDHAYKTNKELKAEEQMISALPDVKHAKIGPKDEFMILACDGLWNSFTSEEVVAFVRERIEKGAQKMSEICEELFTKCLAPNTCGDGTGCDNMTAVIIQFQKALTERCHDTDKPIAEENTSKKRPISPATDIEPADSDTSKRIKTDENHGSDEINTEVK